MDSGLMDFGSKLEVIFNAPSEVLALEQSTEILKLLKNQPEQGFMPVRNLKTKWDGIQSQVLYFDLSKDRCSSKEYLKKPRVLKIQPNDWPSLKEMEVFLVDNVYGRIKILLEDNSILMSFDGERGCLDIFERP